MQTIVRILGGMVFVVVALIVLLYVGMGVAVIACNRPQPMTAEQALDAITFFTETPGVANVYEGAKRLHNGRVKVYLNREWVTPSGEVIQDKPDCGWDIVLKGNDVKLFAGEIHEGENFFLQKGILYLRTDVRHN